MSDQSADAQLAQANKEAEELAQTLSDQLQRGRINETFKATLNDEGYIVPSGHAPTTSRQTMLMLATRRLATMDTLDDGTIAITLNREALKTAAEKRQADAQQAQGKEERFEAIRAAQNERKAALDAEYEKDQLRADIAKWRRGIRI